MSRLTINSNIASLNAQRNFGNATKKLSESYTRLSSGLRINKASDDAAGLSISESLKADTRLFNQGVRNLNDGASLLNIADGALEELSNIVIRLNELAESSANGTLGNKQRLALNEEAQALSSEYNRIARSTAFNGRNLFNADFGELKLVAGGGAETIISYGLGGAIADGSFQGATSLASGDGPNVVKVADLNRDGISDLVVNDTLGFNSSIFIGDGNGSFLNRVSYSYSFGQNYDVEVVDMNNDGILDLASVYATHIQVSVGNGDGSFRKGVSYTTVAQSYNLISGDFNGDGISDIVASSYNGSQLTILINNGNGTFSAGTTYPTGTFPRGVSVGDFNGDGILDLVSPNQGGFDLQVYLGNGNGTFTARTTYAIGQNSQEVVVGDFNGDGISDLASADSGSDRMSVLFGNGNGSFKARSSYITGDNPNSIATGDFNRDGSLDLVTANNLDDSISIFLANSDDGVGALQNFSLKTQLESRQSMTYFRTTLESLGEQRGQIGAFQSRVETATNNLRQSSLAYSEANSRITDADIAEESSKLTANQILQQASASVLAQANLQPRLVLQLLEGI